VGPHGEAHSRHQGQLTPWRLYGTKLTQRYQAYPLAALGAPSAQLALSPTLLTSFMPCVNGRMTYQFMCDRVCGLFITKYSLGTQVLMRTRSMECLPLEDTHTHTADTSPTRAWFGMGWLGLVSSWYLPWYGWENHRVWVLLAPSPSADIKNAPQAACALHSKSPRVLLTRPPVDRMASKAAAHAAAAGAGATRSALRSIPREEMEDILLAAGVDVGSRKIQAKLAAAADPKDASQLLVDTTQDDLLLRVCAVSG
jgi:hypothetical protein